MRVYKQKFTCKVIFRKFEEKTHEHVNKLSQIAFCRAGV